jgi:hypothetical protein
MDRRAAREEFKSRKTDKGVFAVRCAAGPVWVSSSRNLAASRTGLWFCLRNGMHHNKQLQAAWNQHGEAAFTFEVLETFEEDMPPILLKDACSNRQKHWQLETSARAV